MFHHCTPTTIFSWFIPFVLISVNDTPRLTADCVHCCARATTTTANVIRWHQELPKCHSKKGCPNPESNNNTMKLCVCVSTEKTFSMNISLSKRVNKRPLSRSHRTVTSVIIIRKSEGAGRILCYRSSVVWMVLMMATENRTRPRIHPEATQKWKYNNWMNMLFVYRYPFDVPGEWCAAKTTSSGLLISNI